MTVMLRACVLTVTLATGTFAQSPGASPESSRGPLPGEHRETPDGTESLIQSSVAETFSGAVDDWRIDDGVLVGIADGTLKTNRFIVAKTDSVADFQIEVDVWISRQGNSGLQYRSEARDDLGPAVMVGYQCDVVAGNPNYNGMLYEERGRRILCHTGQRVVTDSVGQGWVVATWEVPKFAAETWHRYRIEVRGNVHRHWIDDVMTAEHIDLDADDRRLSGSIGVQVHVGPPMEVRYRNFFLTRFSDDSPIVTEFSIPDDAPKIVPQGGPQAAGQRDSNFKLENSSLPDTFKVMRAGPIWLASQPSERALRELAKSGVTRVITLRTIREIDFDDAAIVEASGMKFEALRFGGHRELTPEIFDAARETLKTARPGDGVLLHCASTNRVGAIWLAHRVLDGRQELPLAITEARKVGLVDPELQRVALEYVKSKRRP